MGWEREIEKRYKRKCYDAFRVKSRKAKPKSQKKKMTKVSDNPSKNLQKTVLLINNG